MSVPQLPVAVSVTCFSPGVRVRYENPVTPAGGLTVKSKSEPASVT
jgi:hypothetical protein